MCSFLLTGVILKELTLRKCVSDVCVCMFYVCKVIGFVDSLDKSVCVYIYICLCVCVCVCV